VDVELIPGEHTTFLREPHVRFLAEKIRARIPAAAAKEASSS
jgi:hypothetical protein